MAQVGIVMGSDSDMPVMAKAADILEELGITYEMTIISAHREPDVFFEYAKNAEEKGFKVIIAGSGRCGFPLFYRTDAVRHPGGDGSNQRRPECGYSRGEDSGNFRCGAVAAVEGLCTVFEGERSEKGCPPERSWL